MSSVNGAWRTETMMQFATIEQTDEKGGREGRKGGRKQSRAADGKFEVGAWRRRRIRPPPPPPHVVRQKPHEERTGNESAAPNKSLTVNPLLPLKPLSPLWHTMT